MSGCHPAGPYKAQTGEKIHYTALTLHWRCKASWINKSSNCDHCRFVATCVQGANCMNRPNSWSLESQIERSRPTDALPGGFHFRKRFVHLLSGKLAMYIAKFQCCLNATSAQVLYWLSFVLSHTWSHTCMHVNKQIHTHTYIYRL